MLKELIIKRISEYEEYTSKIFQIYEEKLIRAIRFFAKTDKDIQLTSVYLYPTNPNFVVNTFKVSVSNGDKIKTPEGNVVLITDENKDNLYTNELTVVLPIKLLEEGTAIQLYEEIVFMDSFISKYGQDIFSKVMMSGIASFNSLLDKEHESLLEEITNPIDSILQSLDELQRIQYNLFSNDSERRIH